MHSYILLIKLIRNKPLIIEIRTKLLKCGVWSADFNGAEMPYWTARITNEDIRWVLIDECFLKPSQHCSTVAIFLEIMSITFPTYSERENTT